MCHTSMLDRLLNDWTFKLLPFLHLQFCYYFFLGLYARQLPPPLDASSEPFVWAVMSVPVMDAMLGALVIAFVIRAGWRMIRR